MKLIVGLGNPGRKYDGTRHNIGFRTIEDLARQFGTSEARSKFQGEYREALIRGEKALLLCPHTFMNLSGSCVQPTRDFFKIENKDLLVICDDLNLPLAKLRFRATGSAGGQKGLADIIKRLGTEDVPRLRFGVGQPPEIGSTGKLGATGRMDAADYVLARFREDERPAVDEALKRAVKAVEDWVSRGTDYCMNQYNN